MFNCRATAGIYIKLKLSSTREKKQMPLLGYGKGNDNTTILGKKKNQCLIVVPLLEQREKLNYLLLLLGYRKMYGNTLHK
jgi:hypothetical protein